MLILVSGQTADFRRLASQGSRNLGCLLAPGNGNSMRSVLATGLPWGVDNAAFSDFCPERFSRLLARVAHRTGCLFVVVPDVVGDAGATLARFWEWLEKVMSAGQPLAFVGQDGAENLDIPWQEFATWFVGGSTEWKLSNASADMIREAKRRGKWVHVGRVNSLRRLRWCHSAGADSVDGSGYSRFAKAATLKGRTDMLLERHLRYLANLERRSREQPLLFGEDQ